MDNGQEQTMLAFLADHGFGGEKLERELTKQMAYNLPAFNLFHRIDYPEAQVRFRLYFEKVNPQRNYSLRKYSAAYIPNLEHKIINGIDSWLLEGKMAGIDWHLQPLDSSAAATTGQRIKAICADLWRLSDNESMQGKALQDWLRIKYWSDTPYETPDIRPERPRFEVERKFENYYGEICSVHQAYYVLTGRIYEVSEPLTSRGFDLYNQIENGLKYNTSQFKIKERRYNAEGIIDYTFELSQNAGILSVGGCQATLELHPQITHGIYGDISTRDLEKELQAINWLNLNELMVSSDDEAPELKPHVKDLVSTLMSLYDQPDAQEVAERLMLKYFRDRDFFSDFIPDATWQKEDLLQVRSRYFEEPLPALVIYNLLCGRSFLPDLHPAGSPEWQCLDFDIRDKDGNYPLKPAGDFSHIELRRVAKMLPLRIPQDPFINGLLYQLKLGQMYAVEMNNGRTYYLSADPKNKTIDITDNEGELIHTNLRLEKNWRPPLKRKRGM